MSSSAPPSGSQPYSTEEARKLKSQLADDTDKMVKSKAQMLDELVEEEFFYCPLTNTPYTTEAHQARRHDRVPRAMIKRFRMESNDKESQRLVCVEVD